MGLGGDTGTRVVPVIMVNEHHFSQDRQGLERLEVQMPAYMEKIREYTTGLQVVLLR